MGRNPDCFRFRFDFIFYYSLRIAGSAQNLLQDGERWPSVQAPRPCTFVSNRMTATKSEVLQVNKKHVPVVGTVFTCICASALAFLLDIDSLTDMISIGER